MDNKFVQKSSGNIEYTPITKDIARFDYNQLRERLSYIREKIDKEQKLLDITPKENDDLQKGCLENLIMLKYELTNTENQFESVKKWFDKNNYPYPWSHEDKLKKKKKQKLLDEYKSHFRKKIRSLDEKDWNGFIYTLADEMRDEKKNGVFETYREAYQWCEKNYTVNGKPITWKQLENNYDKAKFIGKVD